MKNPVAHKTPETKPQRLWPIHCVQNTHGAMIIPEVDVTKFDTIVTKGMDARVEMYSAFADAFGNKDCAVTGGANMDLEEVLRRKNVTDVFIVGVAGDYCVTSTAIDATERGFKTWVIEEGTKCVDSISGWDLARMEMSQHAVQIIGANGPELLRVEV